jgi:hypothetical protein
MTLGHSYSPYALLFTSMHRRIAGFALGGGYEAGLEFWYQIVSGHERFSEPSLMASRIYPHYWPFRHISREV